MRRLASLRCTTFPHGESPRTFTSAFAEVFRVCAEVSVGKGNRRRSRGFEPLTSAVRALSRAARLFADAIVCRTATHQHVEMEVRFMLGISTRA